MLLENDPSPEVVHVTPVLPEKEPANETFPPTQMVCAGPASTIAAGVMVMVTLSTAGGQPPAPSGSLEVSVKVTMPAATSAALGE